MFSTDIESENLAERNLEKRENREQAKQVLETNSGTAMVASLAAEGGPMARRIAREIRKFESTGRVSNWLAGETIKAESKREIPSTAVDDFLIKGRPISSLFAAAPRRLPFNGDPKFKPEIPSSVTESGAALFPWDLIVENTGTEGSPTWKIKVKEGTLNGFLATNWDEEFIVTSTALHYAIARVFTDGTGITSVTISITTIPPNPTPSTAWGLPSQVDKLFGLFKEGSAKRTIANGNIDLSTSISITTPTPQPASAGELPFINYYQMI